LATKLLEGNSSETTTFIPVLYAFQKKCGFANPRVNANAKKQRNTTMTEQKRSYEKIINRVSDQFVKLTIGLGKEYENALFFSTHIFCF
jgi:hypothetical protein